MSFQCGDSPRKLGLSIDLRDLDSPPMSFSLLPTPSALDSPCYVFSLSPPMNQPAADDIPPHSDLTHNMLHYSVCTRRESREFFKSLRVPVLTQLNNKATQFALQLLLQTCGWYDSRLCSVSMLGRYHNVIYGPRWQRKECADKILEALQCLSQEESQGTVQEKHPLQQLIQSYLTLSTACDVVLRILGNYVCCLARRPHSCFLVQELFGHCSASGKWQVVEEVLEHAKEMAVDDKGNYLVIRVLDFVAGEHRSDEELMEDDYWKAFAQCYTSEAPKFASLARNEFGSFVLKRFVRHNDTRANGILLERLEKCGLKEQLAHHEYAKHVMRHLHHDDDDDNDEEEEE